MPTPRLIVRPPSKTPGELTSSRGSQRALPPDLLREASLRVRIVALLGAVFWSIGTVLGHIAYRPAEGGGRYAWLPIMPASDAIALGAVLLSLALYFYTRHSKREPQFILDLGLGYMVAIALALGLEFHSPLIFEWQQMPRMVSVRPEVSWIAAVVLMFAAILPTSPRKMLVAALLAVSMNPLGMFLAQAMGKWDFGPASNAMLMHYPDFLLVGGAVVISHVVTQLGRYVAKARELGSYRVGELLGKGGMGEVYEATHRMLARPAAIKLIRPEMLGGGEEAAQLAIKRFCREAEAAANLRSPHTVEVYDFGTTDDGTFYLVMEMLEGMDLERMVRRHGPLPVDRVIHILRQVCDSLEEAHVRGLVHRDIKPANIHVGRVGLRHDFVKVLDFGLAKPMSQPSGVDSLETAAGLTPGTPAYMAPEILGGEGVDGRADIYALGCVAYYMLTGKLVLDAESPMQMVVRHMTVDPVPPSRRTDRHVSPVLDDTVLSCLAKDPAERMPSAAALDRALAAVRVEPWGEEQASRWWNSREGGGEGRREEATLQATGGR
jgi:tRNA A-37 threonylcarbamoyl transferase component Bud32